MDPNGMNEETDDEIREKIRIRFYEFFGGKLHLVVIDGVKSGGRPYEEWHDEILQRIDKIRKTEEISADKAGNQIAEPYLKKHNVTFKSFMAAYWCRKRERSEERFMRALSKRDMEATVDAYKKLSKDSKQKLGLK